MLHPFGETDSFPVEKIPVPELPLDIARPLSLFDKRLKQFESGYRIIWIIAFALCGIRGVLFCEFGAVEYDLRIEENSVKFFLFRKSVQFLHCRWGDHVIRIEQIYVLALCRINTPVPAVSLLAVLGFVDHRDPFIRLRVLIEYLRASVG